MSFDRFCRPSLLAKLQLCDSHHDPRDEDLSGLSQRLTLGLNRLFYNLYVKTMQPSGPVTTDKFYTDNDGLLQSLDNDISALLANRYRIEEVIGQGNFSQVFRVADTWRGDDLFAMKLVRKGCDVLAKRELVILRHLNDDCTKGANCFVSCVKSLRILGHVALILPFYSHTLERYLAPTCEKAPRTVNPVPILQPKARNGFNGATTPSAHSSPQMMHASLPTSTAHSTSLPIRELNSDDLAALRKISLTLVSALIVMHRENLIHGDLKPENVFIEVSPSSVLKFEDITQSQTEEVAAPAQLRQLPSTFTVKLGDFGSTIHLTETKDYFKEFEIQSLPYRAPEVLIGQHFGTSIDIWSLGVLLIEMCTGVPLFSPINRTDALLQIEQQLGYLDRKRFSGGMFSHLLFDESFSRRDVSQLVGNESLASSLPSISMKALLLRYVAVSAPVSETAELVDFLSQMLVVDPSSRATARELLGHRFVTSLLPIPYSLMNTYNSTSNDTLSARKRKMNSISFHSLRSDDSSLSSNLTRRNAVSNSNSSKQ